jgi:hypothetical protein
MPNFIDTTLYRPIKNSEEKRSIRQNLGIPENAFVIGTAAAIKKHHKRIDYLIREFAAFVGEGKRVGRGEWDVGRGELGVKSSEKIDQRPACHAGDAKREGGNLVPSA